MFQLKFSLKTWNNISIGGGGGPPGYALKQDSSHAVFLSIEHGVNGMYPPLIG